MGKKSKGSCKATKCCSPVEELQQQVLPYVNTIRVPVSAGDNSMADTYKALSLAIKEEVETGINFLVSKVPESQRKSLQLSNHHTISETDEAKLLTVTVVAMWPGTSVSNPSKPKETKNERRTATPEGGQAVPGRERRILKESEFPPEVQLAAAQLRGQLNQKGGKEEESSQGQQASRQPTNSQQSFEVKSKEPAGQKPVQEPAKEQEPTSSLPPSDSNPGQAPTLGGVFDD